MRSSWTVLPLLAGIISASVAVPCSAAESRRTAIVRAIESTRDSVVNIHGQKLVAGADDEPAGELRRVGGYAKDTIPFSEFQWADFLRRKISRKSVEENFAKSMEKGLGLVKSKDAIYLPGWCGPASDDAAG